MKRITADEIGTTAKVDPRAWARRIIERHEHKDGSITPLVLQMARDAISGKFRGGRKPREVVRTPGEDDE